jgi:hypothetical protein
MLVRNAIKWYEKLPKIFFVQTQQKILLKIRLSIFQSVFEFSAGAYTTTLYVMVTGWKGLGVHPPLSQARADFSIIMGWPPEILDNLVDKFLVPDRGKKSTIAKGCRIGPPVYVAWTDRSDNPMP